MFIFDNVMFAGTVIVRDQMESQNYTPSAGASGWALLANGDAFLNNATLRGAFQIGPNPGNHILGHVNGGIAQFEFFTGDAAETSSGEIDVFAALGGPGQMTIATPDFGDGQSLIYLRSALAGNSAGVIGINASGTTTGVGTLELTNTAIDCSPMASVQGHDAAARSTASAAVWVTASGTASATVVTPPSGSIKVALDSLQSNNTAANAGLMSFEVRANNAAGAVLWAPGAANYFTWLFGTIKCTCAMTRIATGFTPGTVLFVRPMFLSGNAANTASFQDTNIVVTPEL